MMLESALASGGREISWLPDVLMRISRAFFGYGGKGAFQVHLRPFSCVIRVKNGGGHYFNH